MSSSTFGCSGIAESIPISINDVVIVVEMIDVVYKLSRLNFVIIMNLFSS